MKLIGTAPSKGIALGKTHYIQQYKTLVAKVIIDNPKEELHRLDEAVLSISLDLENIATHVRKNVGEQKAQIFEAHIQILKDPELYKIAKRIIEVNMLSASFAFDAAIETYAQAFEQMDNTVLNERAIDLRDISRRVIAKLENKTNTQISFNEDVILVVNELLPSDVTLLTNKHVKGIIAQIGGMTSHISILARSLNIPYIFGVDNIWNLVSNNQLIILDTTMNTVIQNPTSQEIDSYIKQINDLEQVKSLEENGIISKTIDGKVIDVNININYDFELDNITNLTSTGVGLFRTEFLFMDRFDLPSFDEQLNVYQKVLKAVAPNKVVIRTLDVGGDKELNAPYKSFEINPSLGCRSIRYCLNNPELFKTQLRALLTASSSGNLHLMLPMVSTFEEFIEAHTLIKDIENELLNDNIKFSYKLGIMIEVPSAIYIIEHLAEFVDFFSIGSNDLIQYLFAADRNNDTISHLYQPLNPVFVKVLKQIIDESHKYQKPVSICGEMGSTNNAIPLLVALGIDEISAIPNVQNTIKDIISKCDKSELIPLLDKILDLKQEAEVIKLLENYLIKINK